MSTNPPQYKLEPDRGVLLYALDVRIARHQIDMTLKKAYAGVTSGICACDVIRHYAAQGPYCRRCVTRERKWVLNP